MSQSKNEFYAEKGNAKTGVLLRVVGMASSEVVENGKGLTTGNYEPIVRNLDFILNVLVNHWGF